MGSSGGGATSKGRVPEPLCASAPEPAFFLVAGAILRLLSHSRPHGRRQLLVVTIAQTVFVGPEKATSQSQGLLGTEWLADLVQVSLEVYMGPLFIGQRGYMTQIPIIPLGFVLGRSQLCPRRTEPREGGVSVRLPGAKGLFTGGALPRTRVRFLIPWWCRLDDWG